jgi:propanol-preferring alcohol dehydrogenase
MMASGEIRIQASAVGTREDLRGILAMAASGEVRCLTATRPLAHANQVLDELRQGQVAGRVVLTCR